MREGKILRHPMNFELVSMFSLIRVKVELRYNTLYPYEVIAAFPNNLGGWNEKTFARQLLSRGLFYDNGEGDINVRPSGASPGAVLIEVRNPYPKPNALYIGSIFDILAFLGRTYNVVLPGTENIEITSEEIVNFFSKNS